jgi:CelD/BcsL family acetyltransferase involved in cellulose biosynthesis
MLIDDGKWQSEVINTQDRFLSVQHEWKAFQQSLSDPHSSPFLSWDWFYLWWEIYKKPSWQLAIGVIRYDQQIVALFPFYIKLIPLRQLYFLGTGEPELQEVATEYLDCLVNKDSPAVLSKASEFLNRFVEDVDVVVFQRMLESACIRTLINWQEKYPLAKETACGHRYCLAIEAGWEPLVARFGSNLKRKVRKFFRGSIEKSFVFERCKNISELDGYMSHLIRLHEMRWQSKGKVGAFSSRQFLKFHNRYARDLLQSEQLFLAILKIDGQVAGCIYAFDVDGTRYFYQAGFHPGMQELAPGHFTHFAAIDSAIRQGLRRYDFMAGGINGTYKSQYVAPGELLITYIGVRYQWQMLLFRFWNKCADWLVK